jgi:hypothetical protein
MRRMTPDGRRLATVWPFVSGQLPPAPASVLETGRRRRLHAVVLLAGLAAAVWVIAVLTAASGLVVAVRMYETHRPVEQS